MNSHEILEAFDEVFDCSIVFHGFAKHMRDYDVFIYIPTDPQSGIKPWYLRYRFTHCVRASVKTTVPSETWRGSLDERLLDYKTAVEFDVEGYIWGVNWMDLYPGISLAAESPEADGWAERIGIPFHEALIETNAHAVELVFSDLVVTKLDAGFVPIIVPVT